MKTHHDQSREEVAFDEEPTYEVTLASYYLDIPFSTLRSWVAGRPYAPRYTGRFEPIILRPQGSSLMSFTNLVEAHVLRALRKTHRIPMEKVRKAVETLRDKFGDDHPLAQHEFFADTDLFIKPLGKLSNLTTPEQALLGDFMLSHVRRVIKTESKAVGLRPLPHNSMDADSIAPVVIDVRESFGEPTIDGTGIAMDPVLSRWAAGESVISLANDYRIPLPKVEDLLRWSRDRGRAAA